MHRHVEAQRWQHVEELLAQLLEVSHAHYRATLQAHGAKGRDVPKPLHYRRPWETKKDKPPAATREQIKARIPVRR